MDDKKIDESIAAKESKIRSIDKKAAELAEQKKKLMESIETLKARKSARFSRQLLEGLRKNGVPLNAETLQNLLAAVKTEENNLNTESDKLSEEAAESSALVSGGMPASDQPADSSSSENRLFSSFREFGE